MDLRIPGRKAAEPFQRLDRGGKVARPECQQPQVSPGFVVCRVDLHRALEICARAGDIAHPVRSRPQVVQDVRMIRHEIQQTQKHVARGRRVPRFEMLDSLREKRLLIRSRCSVRIAHVARPQEVANEPLS